MNKDAPKTVSVRILREGPTHNHLLSPLTPYLAEVGRYEATTLRVPYEHRRLLRELNALRYGATADVAPDLSRIRAPDRRIVADDIGAILGSIPGLSTELTGESECHPQLSHLKLVFSAAELSLLPFELATSPRGFPGSGLPLSVQNASPVVITRCVPNAIGDRCIWPSKPKILFVCASPSGMPEVPFNAHLAALVKALHPWIGPLHLLDRSGLDRSTLRDRPAAAVEEFLTIIPRATRAQIEEKCRAEAYTHVHILAHSVVA